MLTGTPRSRSSSRGVSGLRRSCGNPSWAPGSIGRLSVGFAGVVQRTRVQLLRVVSPGLISANVCLIPKVRLPCIGLLGIVEPEVRRAPHVLGSERPTFSHENHVRLRALPHPIDTQVLKDLVETAHPGVSHAVAPRVVGVRRVRPLAQSSSVALDRQIAPFEQSRVGPVSPGRIGVSCAAARARDEHQRKDAEPTHWHTPLTQLMPVGQAWKIEEQVIAHEPSRLPVRSDCVVEMAARSKGSPSPPQPASTPSITAATRTTGGGGGRRLAKSGEACREDMRMQRGVKRASLISRFARNHTLVSAGIVLALSTRTRRGRRAVDETPLRDRGTRLTPSRGVPRSLRRSRAR